MSDQVIQYEKRATGKKHYLTELRKKGQVPCVVYGGSGATSLISVDTRDIFRQLKRGSFFSTIYQLEDSSGSGDGVRVLPRDVQMHPVKDVPWHVDFLRVSEQTILRVFVPVHFIDEEKSPGLKGGGILNIVRHEVELVGRMGVMPHSIEVSLEGFEIGDPIRISSVTLPKGVKPTITNRDFTIANIAVPRIQDTVEVVEEDRTEEAEEGSEE